MEAGARAVYDTTKSTSGGVALEVGAKTCVAFLHQLTCINGHFICSYLDSAAFIKAKINNSGVLALGKYIAFGQRCVTDVLVQPTLNRFALVSRLRSVSLLTHKSSMPLAPSDLRTRSANHRLVMKGVANCSSSLVSSLPLSHESDGLFA